MDPKLIKLNGRHTFFDALYYFEALLSSTTAILTQPTIFSGCGPSGMFFLHALATKRMELQEQGDLEALAALPRVTVFEKAASPGGVWRSDRGVVGNTSNDTTTILSTSTNMYEGLWTNGNKDVMEFFDYTFEEHFKTPQPVYMPRKHILEYILKRVTLHEDIFQHVHFNTEVKFATYNDETQEFVLDIENLNGTRSTHHYDKLVWASGLNAKPKMVPSIVKKLSNFKGKIVHSSQVDNLGTSVEGKNLLLIGGNLSGEDLALSFIKLGANSIYVTSRNSHDDVIHSTASWPYDKVDVLEHSTPCGSGIDGTTVRVCKSDYDGTFEDDSYDLENISIIVFCTGYEERMDYLDSSISPCWMNDSCKTQTMDDDWVMKPHVFTDVLGHVEPAENITIYDLYENRVLTSNPNMCYIFENTNYPLLEVELAAWHCMRFVTGELEIPSREQMEESLRMDIINKMDDHLSRYQLDEEYWYKFQKFHSSIILDADWETEIYMDHLRIRKNIEEVAGIMDVVKYPLRLSNSNGELNDAGIKLLAMAIHNDNSRYETADIEADVEWKTFRDTDPSSYASILTGMKSVPLQGKWLDIDDEGNLLMPDASHADIEAFDQAIIVDVISDQ